MKAGSHHLFIFALASAIALLPGSALAWANCGRGKIYYKGHPQADGRGCVNIGVVSREATAMYGDNDPTANSLGTMTSKAKKDREPPLLRDIVQNLRAHAACERAGKFYLPGHPLHDKAGCVDPVVLIKNVTSDKAK